MRDETWSWSFSLIISPLIFPNDYLWLESYLSNDSLWFEDTLNWDETFDLIGYDFMPIASLFAANFINEQFFINMVVKFSSLDVILLLEIQKTLMLQKLFLLYLFDICFPLQNKLTFVSFFFYSDYQDSTVMFLYFSPELILALESFVNVFWENSVFATACAASFDIFADSNMTVVSEFLSYFFLFYLFIWFIILFVNFLNLFKISNPLEIPYLRFVFYLNSLSKETRIQTEAVFQLTILVLFYLMMGLATFDDDQEEIMEFLDLMFFSYFLILICFLVYKYSVHYFSFLEASDIKGRSVAFVIKQFFRDIMGTIGLFLRFFILLFRLNVYDNLDDFYDSYYIFVGDFDDDEYANELFLSWNSLFFFDADSHDDGAFSLEDENDFFMDLFFLYFVNWSKLFLFLLFILEEIFRIALALYISYLIIFEIHAANCSYLEDNFFQTLKQRRRGSNDLV